MTRQWQFSAIASALAFGLVLTTATQAAERKPAGGGDAQWPNVTIDEEPQWPKVSVAEPFYPGQPIPPVSERDTNASLAARRAAILAGSSVQFPKMPAAAPRPATPAAQPAKADPLITASTKSRQPAAGADIDPQWPKVSDAEPPFPTIAARAALADADIRAAATPRTPVYAAPQPASPFGFEAGLRYWYSSGLVKWAFANNQPLFGSPTSTIDWHDIRSQSGEMFGRIDHKPTGLFAKAMVGMGTTTGGTMTDRDYLITQFIFSDTDSRVKGDTFTYATLDLGYAFEPMGGMRIGGFVGYQYWREKAVAYGLVCNVTNPFGGCPAGAVLYDYATPVMSYEPTWHAVRIGFDGKMTLAERWTFTAEIAGIPYAHLRNGDTHLLRTGTLGPGPNIVSTSRSGFGVAAEMFVNYAITPNIEIGAGVRYWQMVTRNGTTQFGPSFTASYPMQEFDMQRYGALLQVKGKF